MFARRAAWALVVTAAACASGWIAGAGQLKPDGGPYTVGARLTQDNLTIFPVIANLSQDTGVLLTLDEGIRSGQVVITEDGGAAGLQRSRPRGIGEQQPVRPAVLRGAQVNQLALVNNSDRPLVLIAGEIVTGGKQDRVVGKDLIIPPKSDPVALDVFCVEPHRWVQTASNFGSLGVAMAQPSIRMKAQAAEDQQAVWNEVAKSRNALAAAVPAPAAQAIQQTSSYAGAVSNDAVQRKMETVAGPIGRSYEKLFSGLRSQKAVGAVVAINGELVWADVFASSALLEKYCPKLIRSYAAEAVASRMRNVNLPLLSEKDAQLFLDDLRPVREKIESEPGVFRTTEIVGDGFDAFILTSLLPGMGYVVHIAKMKN
jgi:hypothetical protein